MIKIRKAKPKDKEKILLLVKKFYSKSAPKSVNYWQNNYKDIIKNIELTYIIKTAGIIKAYISCKINKNSLHIEDLYVLPKFRRKGIASKLLKKIESECKKLNKKYLTVNNRKKDRAAFNFYSKNGFSMIKRKQAKSLKLIKVLNQIKWK